jgi:hypothetical protein
MTWALDNLKWRKCNPQSHGSEIVGKPVCVARGDAGLNV